MKNILEVTKYGDFDIRFNTDLDVAKNPEIIMDITSKVAYAMMTNLWGGNETTIIAIIRALAIADLACCANQKEMLKQFEQAAKSFSRAFQDAKKELERRGGKVVTFYPGAPASPKPKS